jgi:hypothetical protein
MTKFVYYTPRAVTMRIIKGRKQFLDLVKNEHKKMKTKNEK